MGPLSAPGFFAWDDLERQAEARAQMEQRARKLAREMTHSREIQSERPLAELLDSMNTLQKVGLAQIPLVSDAAGFLGDLQMYAEKPEERGWFNYGMTGLGLLPFVPGMISPQRATKFTRNLNVDPRTAQLMGDLDPPKHWMYTDEGAQRFAETLPAQRKWQGLLGDIMAGRAVNSSGGIRLPARDVPPGYFTLPNTASEHLIDRHLLYQANKGTANKLTKSAGWREAPDVFPPERFADPRMEAYAEHVQQGADLPVLSLLNQPNYFSMVDMHALRSAQGRKGAPGMFRIEDPQGKWLGFSGEEGVPGKQYELTTLFGPNQKNPDPNSYGLDWRSGAHAAELQKVVQAQPGAEDQLRRGLERRIAKIASSSGGAQNQIKNSWSEAITALGSPRYWMRPYTRHDIDAYRSLLENYPIQSLWQP